MRGPGRGREVCGAREARRMERGWIIDLVVPAPRPFREIWTARQKMENKRRAFSGTEGEKVRNGGVKEQ